MDKKIDFFFTGFSAEHSHVAFSLFRPLHFTDPLIINSYQKHHCGHVSGVFKGLVFLRDCSYHISGPYIWNIKSIVVIRDNLSTKIKRSKIQIKYWQFQIQQILRCILYAMYFTISIFHCKFLLIFSIYFPCKKVDHRCHYLTSNDLSSINFSSARKQALLRFQPWMFR